MTFMYTDMTFTANDLSWEEQALNILLYNTWEHVNDTSWTPGYDLSFYQRYHKSPAPIRYRYRIKHKYDHNVSNRETCTSRTTQETLYTIQCNRFYQRAKISILVPFVNYITFWAWKKLFPLKGFFFPSFRAYSLWCLFCMVYYYSFQCEQRYRGFGLR